MPSTKPIQFNVTIKSPASVVWRHVTNPESYKQWASAFAEGSHFQGTWESGARILFLAPNGDGMVSEIAESRPNKFISIRHLGFITNGVEDTTSEAIRAWAPAFENYTFLSTKEGTSMVVDQDVTAEWEEYICQAWPKALEKLKTLCESSHVT
ncbi:SRPBCC domain-containing protein [Synechococcus sp. FACHB-909]|uniref:SRPBCC family protein n=1 Tax=Synechococcus sp. FACHB-909 TaxID=2692863 RepID=UPI001686AC9C|nr:SRPBCC domain-containing protein [Synechococcus sp. FACHB-909]MBD2717763.1 SRPBCC domain-containing protein [Synechococcus sp. FACHB-909]